MATPNEKSPPAECRDPFDDALEALWRGNSGELDQLLESDEPGGPRVGEVFADVIRGQARPFVGLASQSRINGFQIIRELGRGGMGVVYEAEQLEPRRHVALKVLPGIYTDEYHIRLFRREVQIPARFKHPAIATIYEAGRTDEGQHFFTMELVSGVPLNVHVRERQVPLRQRLELFLRICDAVHYAHQHGVIHRDLKPSNVLIDAKGNPKILDFGLARIIDADVTLTTVITEAGKIMGTLPYMSPEQTRGDPDEIDWRSDVYSLGVMFYELLTGRLPFDVSKVRVPAAVRIICEQTPPRPSTISRAVPGDLETIVLKALEKEPPRRYASALALAEDVKRYLTDRPILARPPSVMYRLRKFARRNRGLVVGGVLVLLTLALGFAGTAWQAVRATEERNRALAAERITEQIMTFLLQDMLTSVNPQDTQGTNVTVRQVLDQASRRVETEFADQPRVEAALRETIARTYRSLGLYDNAELHLRAALDIRRQFSDEEPARFVAALRGLANVLRDKREYKESELLHHEALATARKRWGDEHPEIARSLTVLGDLYRDMRDYEAAESRYRSALAMWRRLRGVHHVDVARSLFDLAELHHSVGQYDIARSLYGEALVTFGNLEDQPLGEAEVLNNVANLWRAEGDLETAEQMHRQVLAIRREHLGDLHPDVATTRMNLAALLRQKGNPADHAEVEALYREALATYQELLDSEHKLVGGTLVSLGAFLTEKGDFERAEAHLRRGLEIWRRMPPKEDWLAPEAESILGECLAGLGRYEEAEPFVVQGYPAAKEALGEEHRRTKLALRRIVRLYEAWDRPDQADEYRALLLSSERPEPMKP